METLEATFDTRRDAEMTVERLVQEFGLDRGAITIMAAGPENSAGEEPSGADEGGEQPDTGPRDDAALNGRIKVSVRIEDAEDAKRVRSAFAEFDGTRAG